MGVLVDARAEVSALLVGAGITAYPYLPARIAPPVAVVQGGSPYLENGNTYGSFLIRHEVIVISNTMVNEATTNKLDDMVEEAVVVLAQNQYGVESVSQPYSLETNNAVYPAVTLVVTHTISF